MQAKDMLRDANPAVRKEGVKLVARMKNHKALRILEHILETEHDPDVLSYAKKASQYVDKQLQEVKPAEEESVQPATNSLSYKPIKRTETYVSVREIERGKMFVDQAIAFGDDTPRALDALKKALKANPTLYNDAFFGALAGSVTGLRPNEAIIMVESGEGESRIRDAYYTTQRSKQLSDHQSTVEKQSWESIMVDLGMLMMVVFAGLFLLMLVLQQGSAQYVSNTDPTIQEYGNYILEAGEGSTQIDLNGDGIPEDQTMPIAMYMMASVIQQYIGFPTVLGISMLSAVSTLISTILTVYVVHFLATTVMGGNGRVPYTMYRIATLYTMQYGILLGILLVAAALLTYFRFPVMVVFIPVGIAVSILGLVFLFQTIGRIRQAYDFGFLKGCLTLIVGSFVVSIISSIFSQILNILLSGFFVSLSAAMGL